MCVRPADPADEDQIQTMAQKLFEQLYLKPPRYDHDNEQLFVWDDGDGQLGGFISVSIRPWTEGSERAPVPHIEGWFVDEAYRQRGIGRALYAAVENWCLAQGFTELCADVETHNVASLQAHARLGFTPTLRVQYFRKLLGAAAPAGEAMASFATVAAGESMSTASPGLHASA